MASLDKNVFRIFEVRAKPGQARLLRQKLAEQLKGLLRRY